MRGKLVEQSIWSLSDRAMRYMDWWLILLFFSTPIGVHPSPCPPSPWWYHRTLSQGPRLQVQLREVDLPQVLRTFNPMAS